MRTYIIFAVSIVGQSMAYRGTFNESRYANDVLYTITNEDCGHDVEFPGEHAVITYGTASMNVTLSLGKMDRQSVNFETSSKMTPISDLAVTIKSILSYKVTYNYEIDGPQSNKGVSGNAEVFVLDYLLSTTIHYYGSNYPILISSSERSNSTSATTEPTRESVMMVLQDKWNGPDKSIFPRALASCIETSAYELDVTQYFLASKSS
ncbi:uncharacterized protein LOC134542589 [Bacillus rossius redtenbacheri]|uniref:uncharacterized protein LOC134542589 n=1 Tax=Bacillus rossius redtenbacheri TaxID=93214 RepID=UPI002FDE51AB